MKYLKEIGLIVLGVLIMYVVSLGTNLHLRVMQVEKHISRIDNNISNIMQVLNQCQTKLKSIEIK